MSRELPRTETKRMETETTGLNKVKMCEKNFMKPLDKLQNP